MMFTRNYPIIYIFSFTVFSFVVFSLAKLQLSTSLVSRLQLVFLQNLRVLLLLLLLLTLSLCLLGTLSSSLVLLVYLFTVCVFRAGKRGFFLLFFDFCGILYVLLATPLAPVALPCLFVAVLLFDSFVFCCLRRRRCLLYLHL